MRDIKSAKKLHESAQHAQKLAEMDRRDRAQKFAVHTKIEKQETVVI